MTIFVMGDAGYDHYVVGKVRGLSAEAAIPILDQTSELTLAGMAGNVVSNLANLAQGMPVEVKYLERVQQNYPLKTRVMTEDGIQLARFDSEDWCRPYDKADLVGLLEADAIVVADYGKGSISEEVIQILRQTTLPIFVDTKNDPSPWIGSEAIMFPNLAEYKKYEEKYKWFPRVVLKRGPDGLAFLEFGQAVLSRSATARFVRSVNGAGDTVIAAFALASLAGFTLPECLDFANACAANVVEQPFGNRWTTTPEALERMNEDERTSDPVEPSRDLVVSHAGGSGDVGLPLADPNYQQRPSNQASDSVPQHGPSIVELFIMDGGGDWLN